MTFVVRGLPHDIDQWLPNGGTVPGGLRYVGIENGVLVYQYVLPDVGCVCAGSGCFRCCERCNYDRHECPGCGQNLKHSQKVCEECK